MMNAEVTAENRPACNPTQYMCTSTSSKAYKYQCRVQILIIFLHELLIVIVGFLSIIPVELSANIPPVW